MMKHSEIFQILSEQIRLRALMLIASEGELCVCELVHALDTSQPKISRHMATMRDAEIVVARRHAQWVFYGINPSLAPWQHKIVEATIEGTSSQAIVKKDKSRLAKMLNRPQRCNVA